jgi:hypothetical protein
VVLKIVERQFLQVRKPVADPPHSGARSREYSCASSSKETPVRGGAEDQQRWRTSEIAFLGMERAIDAALMSRQRDARKVVVINETMPRTTNRR